MNVHPKVFKNVDEYVAYEASHEDSLNQDPEQAQRMGEAFKLLGYKDGPVTQVLTEGVTDPDKPRRAEETAKGNPGYTEAIEEEGGLIYKDGTLVGQYLITSRGGFYMTLNNIQNGNNWECSKGAYSWRRT